MSKGAPLCTAHTNMQKEETNNKDDPTVAHIFATNNTAIVSCRVWNTIWKIPCEEFIVHNHWIDH